MTFWQKYYVSAAFFFNFLFGLIYLIAPADQENACLALAGVTNLLLLHGFFFIAPSLDKRK